MSSARNHFCVRWRVKESNGIFTGSPNQSQCVRDGSISWRWAVSTANFSVRANFPVSLEKFGCICIPLQAPAQDVGTLKDRKAFCSPNMQVCAMSSVSSTFSGSFHNAHTVQFCWMSAAWNCFLTDRVVGNTKVYGQLWWTVTLQLFQEGGFFVFLLLSPNHIHKVSCKEGRVWWENCILHLNVAEEGVIFISFTETWAK